MKKGEAVKIFTQLIEKLYGVKDFCDKCSTEVENDLKEISKLFPENRFTREILLLVKTCKLAEGTRKEQLKIAIISDLEQEVRKIKESIHEEEFNSKK